jgi:hypothetical protein
VIEKLAVDYNVLDDQQVVKPTTKTSTAANIEDIKIHFHLEPTTRTKIMGSKKLSDLISHIEKHLNQRVNEKEIVKINTFSMKRNVEKYLRKAMQHCGDLPDFEDKISITIRLSTPAVSVTRQVSSKARYCCSKVMTKKR